MCRSKTSPVRGGGAAARAWLGPLLPHGASEFPSMSRGSPRPAKDWPAPCRGAGQPGGLEAALSAGGASVGKTVVRTTRWAGGGRQARRTGGSSAAITRPSSDGPTFPCPALPAEPSHGPHAAAAAAAGPGRAVSFLCTATLGWAAAGGGPRRAGVPLPARRRRASACRETARRTLRVAPPHCSGASTRVAPGPGQPSSYCPGSLMRLRGAVVRVTSYQS